MKKLILTLSGLLFISILSVEAQSTDTTGRKRDTMHKQQGNEHQKHQKAQKTKYDKKRSSGVQSQGSSNIHERRKITVTEIPASVRQTLMGPEYKGWDDQTTTLYRNKAGDRYTVEFHDGNKIKVYHFDSSGNRIDPK